MLHNVWWFQWRMWSIQWVKTPKFGYQNPKAARPFCQPEIVITRQQINIRLSFIFLIQIVLYMSNSKVFKFSWNKILPIFLYWILKNVVNRGKSLYFHFVISWEKHVCRKHSIESCAIRTVSKRKIENRFKVAY